LGKWDRQGEMAEKEGFGEERHKSALTLTVNVDDVIGTRYLQATRSVVEKYGQERVAWHVKRFLEKVASVYTGLGPLHNLFMEAFADSHVLELRGIAAEVGNQLEVEDLVNVNLLVDLVHLFSSKNGGFSFNLHLSSSFRLHQLTTYWII